MVSKAIANRICQTLVDVQRTAVRAGILDFFVSHAISELKKTLVADINYNIGRFTVVLPFGHTLPVFQRNFPLYDTALARLVSCIGRNHDESLVIDIGANVGDSAATIRCATKWPILCIEGNPDFLSYLSTNAAQLGAVFVAPCLVGKKSEVVDGKVITEGGTGRIVTSNEGKLRIKTLREVLDLFPLLPNVKLIKIDTDGFDLPILHSCEDVLRSSRPVLFFELDPFFYNESELYEVRRYLCNLGYELGVALHNTGEYDREVDLKDERCWRDLLLQYSGTPRRGYNDIAVFPIESKTVAEEFRRGEERTTRILHGIRETEVTT